MHIIYELLAQGIFPCAQNRWSFAHYFKTHHYKTMMCPIISQYLIWPSLEKDRKKKTIEATLGPLDKSSALDPFEIGFRLDYRMKKMAWEREQH